ncbi:MAG TPA: hypothetical protein VG733_02340 [Chthoniobacteraceae bacterium]|nr:hypothetical protein [Chthoniobacteraceae bacterium]
MKKDILILAVAALLAGIPMLHSQDAAAAKDPVPMLKALKASNAELIDKQKKTLDTLDDMAKTADQVRILAKRT